MNIAYCLIVWNKPELLQRIVDRLNQPNVHFYIHVDTKSTHLDQFKAIFKNYETVTILSVYTVYWGGISQVKTHLHMLQLAASSKYDFKYFVLLSGQDYPIKTNAYINDFFANSHCDFLSYNRIEDLSVKYKLKYAHLHFLEFKYLNPKDPHLNKTLYYLYHGLYRRLVNYLPQRAFYKNYIPYFGSTWTALTQATVKYVLQFVENHPDYMRYMSRVEFPSEMFIHNILLNSERKSNVCDYEVFIEWLKNKKQGEKFEPSYSSLKFMDWSDRGKASKPAVLDISYFDEIKADMNLFARKVDDKISLELLNRIDAEILHVQ
jgi:hypothetical protein